MLFSWLRRRRRKRLSAEPFPVEWAAVLSANVPLYARLSDPERVKLCDDLRVIVSEKNWEGCGGFTITDEVKVTIAAQAALLLLGISHDYFARVSSILVYPSGYRSPEGWMGADGIVRKDTGNLGEAWYDGPVVLAWDAVLSGGRNPKDGQNVVIHEFAHQLDYLDGVADGTPPLRGKERNERWHRVMTAEFERLQAESASGHPQVLDEYGAKNPAEFFAVASEAFFEKATAMRVRHPELYAVLADYYNQDPASREWAEPRQPATNTDTPFRGSRAVTKTDPGRQITLLWPGWVTTLWDLHPGVPRDYARRPLGSLWPMAAVIALIAAGYWLVKRELNAGVVLSLLFAAGFAGLAVWLHLAVRWVDRHGVWAGSAPVAPAGSLSAPSPDTVPPQDL